MRKLIALAVAAATTAGGAAMFAQSAQAQPYGYYAPAPRYAPAYPYRDPYYDGRYAPQPYYGDSAAGLAGAVIGSLLGDDVYGGVPYDRYGADPNGMRARDGHRIKCKLQNGYDPRYGRTMTQRVCW